MKYILLCALCLLTGCSTLHLAPEVIDKPALNLADPEPLKLQDVKFVVIHKDNAAKVFADLEAKGVEPVVFALTGEDYKALASNIQDIKTYIKLQKHILLLYRNYYEPRKEEDKKEEGKPGNSNSIFAPEESWYERLIGLHFLPSSAR